MIDLDDVTVTYPGAEQPALRHVSLHVPEGELCLVVGRTGVGKSTLLGAIDGLVPHFTGGLLAGRVTVAGLDTRTHPPHALAGVVGVVMQDPVHGFVTDSVEEELAYGMEQLAVPAAVMRKRVEETLDLLGLGGLRRRPLRTLSGGEQQRVAIGAVLTSHPRVLVLDEPTSALDPAAAEEVLAALLRLVHDLSVTVVLAEHRLERVVEYADMVVTVDDAGAVASGPPADMMQVTAVAPPVVRLGQAVGWEPLPLSVRDARRRADELRFCLRDVPRAGRDGGVNGAAEPQLRARRLTVRYGDVVAVAGVDLDLHRHEVVGVMGRNGSGKSSLLWALEATAREDGRNDVALVPQTPGDLLYLPTVGAECAAADGDRGQPPGTCAGLLARLVPDVDPELHPRDLSEGQRLALALAVQLTSNPSVVFLDEPTRGLDELAKRRLATFVAEQAAAGGAIVIASHDVEFVATAATRVVVLADGEIVADGPTADVVVSSPIFAPQIAKVMHPEPWLTVGEVTAALALHRQEGR